MNVFLSFLGRKLIALTVYFGQIGLLFVETIRSTFQRFRWRAFLEQVLEIGIRSQVVIILTGLFTGAVFTAQIYYQFRKVDMESAAGATLSVAMFRELGPVLAALMLAGRVGAGMAAEIGTMRVTEQIDALRAMGVSPVNYLVVPRLAAMIFCMPILVWQSITFGIWAGYLLAVRGFNLSEPYYKKWMLEWTDHTDVFFALAKAFVFAILIALIACREGLYAEEGAVGVGKATTSSVVYSCLAVLVANFFLTLALTVIFPAG